MADVEENSWAVIMGGWFRVHELISTPYPIVHLVRSFLTADLKLWLGSSCLTVPSSPFASFKILRLKLLEITRSHLLNATFSCGKFNADWVQINSSLRQSTPILTS